MRVFDTCIYETMDVLLQWACMVQSAEYDDETVMLE